MPSPFDELGQGCTLWSQGRQCPATHSAQHFDPAADSGNASDLELRSHARHRSSFEHDLETSIAFIRWSISPIPPWTSIALVHRCHEMDDSLSGIALGCLHLGTVPFIVRWIGEQLPVHWAWNSDSPGTWWDPHMIHMDTDPHDQISWYCTAILEFEHALARDFVLSPAAAEHGRQYVNGRHIICRSPGYMPRPSQAPPHGARVISGQAAGKGRSKHRSDSWITSSK